MVFPVGGRRGIIFAGWRVERGDGLQLSCSLFLSLLINACTIAFYLRRINMEAISKLKRCIIVQVGI